MAEAMQSSVLETFCGRNVLVTGCTGFVGKVILEKILRDISDVGKVFVLIRPRKGSTAMERLEEEIFGSEIWTTLKKQISPAEFLRRKSKIVPLGGDLIRPQLGLSPEHLALLREELHIVIHSAASVDFNERLDRAVELNVMGSLRLQEIAQSCKHVGAYIHVSTAYVNSNRPNGWLDETTYNLGYEPEEMLERIKNLSTAELETITTTGLLGDWPNTYTFTKAMTEQLLLKRRGNLPMVIVRPSIIGSSWQEPVPGWVDCLTAAGAVYMTVGMGVLKFMPGNPNQIADVIPVDYCVNAMLAACANIWQQDRHFICHAASSSENPMHWGVPTHVVMEYFKEHPPSKRLGKPEFKFMRTPQEFQWYFFTKYSVPSSMLNTIAMVGGKKQKQNAKMFADLVFKVRIIINSFKPFLDGEWQFDNRNTRQIGLQLPAEEQALFPLTLANLDWNAYNYTFGFGLQRYVLKEDLIEIEDVHMDKHTSLLSSYWEHEKNEPITKRLFPDVTFVREQFAKRTKWPQARAPDEMVALLINSPKVVAALEAEAKEGHNGRPTTLEAAEDRARAIMYKMFADPKENVLHGMGWFFKKLWKRIYKNITVENHGLKLVKEAAAKGPVIFIPTHRSYIDFLIVSYICFMCDLPIPNIAAGEDFLGIMMVRWLFRHSGAFFLRRSFMGGDNLYTTIFKEYVGQQFMDGQSLEFFIEGTRSRSGKMLHPKLGLLSILTKVFFENQAKDLTIVPISINYEKTMEGDLYSNELLGDSKIKESLKGLLRSSSVLRQTFGSISVNFSKPISLQEYTAQLSSELTALPRELTLCGPEGTLAPAPGPTPAPGTVFKYDPASERLHFEHFNRALAYRVVHDMACQTEAMPTHLVATLMLMYRQGITRAQLVEKVDWLRLEITKRGGLMSGVQAQQRSRIVDNAISHLKHLVVSRHQNVLEPAISSRSEYKNMLVLGHYRNRIVHLFYLEGLFACALYSFGERAHGQGVPRDQLVKEVRFLHGLLSKEFIYKENPDVPDDLDAVLEQMIQRRILKPSDTDAGLVEVHHEGETMFSFLCAMFWPFIDSYFVTVMALFSLQPNRHMEEGLLVQRVQWLGMTLYHQSMLCFYEACSSETLKNALAVLREWNVIEVVTAHGGSGGKKKKKDKSSHIVRLLPPYKTEAKLQELVQHIGRLRKQPPVRENALRRSLIADIPILAKM